MEALIDLLLEKAAGLLGHEVGDLKQMAYANNLGWLWDFARDYLFNYKIWILGLLPALLMELYRPVFRKRLVTPNLILDVAYPLLTLPISLLVTSAIVVGIQTFYEVYIPFANLGLLDDAPLWVQAIGVFLVTDLMFYWSHRLSHEIPWLWYFHTIHHSQTEMNPMTTKRGHPGEAIAKTVIRTLPIGVVGGEPTTWIAFYLLNNFWGYFIHANVRSNLGALSRVIVTPQYHRVHHSIETRHFDLNYGERLTLGDWAFGTLYTGYDEYPATGVRGTEWIVERSFSPVGLMASWTRQMVYPFYKIGASFRTVYRKAAGRDS